MMIEALDSDAESDFLQAINASMDIGRGLNPLESRAIWSAARHDPPDESGRLELGVAVSDIDPALDEVGLRDMKYVELCENWKSSRGKPKVVGKEKIFTRMQRHGLSM